MAKQKKKKSSRFSKLFANPRWLDVPGSSASEEEADEMIKEANFIENYDFKKDRKQKK